MKAHIIFAHPNLQSYNGQLRNTAIQTLESLAWTVTASDLYQMKFKASADEGDFEELANLDFFDLQSEQLQAIHNHTFSQDIEAEHQLLEAADLIILQFPLWWYSVPALLKGYFDRVLSMGWAYGGGKALYGKKVLVCMTTGAPENAWTEENRGTIKDIFKHLFIGTFGLCGLQPLEPFIIYGAKRHSESEKIVTLENFKNYIFEIIK